MKRYTFYGDLVYDAGLIHKLNTELAKLMETDDQFEFWFYRQNPFYELCLLGVWSLKTKFPDKKIDIIRVRRNTPFLYEADFNDYLYDKVRCFPYDPRKKYGHDVNQNWRRIFKRCDGVFTYIYKELHDTKNSLVKYAEGLPGATVTPLTFPDTVNFIRALSEWFGIGGHPVYLQLLRFAS